MVPLQAAFLPNNPQCRFSHQNFNFKSCFSIRSRGCESPPQHFFFLTVPSSSTSTLSLFSFFSSSFPFSLLSPSCSYLHCFLLPPSLFSSSYFFSPSLFLSFLFFLLLCPSLHSLMLLFLLLFLPSASFFSCSFPHLSSPYHPHTCHTLELLVPGGGTRYEADEAVNESVSESDLFLTPRVTRVFSALGGEHTYIMVIMLHKCETSVTFLDSI